MAIKHFTILALTGIASAQMDGMSSSMDSIMATIPPASSTAMVDTVTPISSLSLATATTDSVVPSSTPDMDYSMPADNSTDETVSVPVDATDMTTASIMTDMPSTTDISVTDVSSIMTDTETSSTMDDMGMSGMPMATGGVMPNATATPITPPISGDGMVNGVSTGLFLASVALAALLQL
ncbi:hypothetical protein F5Y18DRAFT_395860 [Xylariaceae sp. FL1019]|nr:hypothetical protein F5Y18DRAFT_395860 [Xylariaceae sp. FL1019]